MSDTPEVTRRERLRIAVIICNSFARNLAYYRAWWGDEHERYLTLARPQENFWIAVNNNFVDMCVMDWCKLFGSRMEKHRWQSIASDPIAFEAGLLHHLGLDAAAFEERVETMLYYRDKTVAHQDLEYTVIVPTLAVAKQAAWFYHAYIVKHEAKPGDLCGLRPDIDGGYEEEVRMAKAVYRAIRH